MGARFLVCLLLAAACAAACEDTATTTSTTPTPTVSEPPFAGTIGINGAAILQFSATARGQVTATVATLDPADAVIGLSVGTWNGASCQVIIDKTDAVQGTVLQPNVSGVGNLCVRVYDSGKLT